ncbi:MAG: hypothetical protein K0R57_4952 [Paenibacillaceae bacterium]|nr:hypothetical protein [Paenibacillaceae bacterium]
MAEGEKQLRWTRLFYSKRQKRLEDPDFLNMIGMHTELQKAHTEWQAAHQRLDWAMEKDQIDYAIYALEAAEKRYVMLLRQAKKLEWAEGMIVAAQARKSQLPHHKDRDGHKRKELGY